MPIVITVILWIVGIVAVLAAALSLWPRVAVWIQGRGLDDHHRIRYSAHADLALPTPAGWLATADAIHTLCREADVDQFAFPSAADERSMLADFWGIGDADRLRGRMLELLRFGHRSAYNAEREFCLALSAEERQRMDVQLKGSASNSPDDAEGYLRFRRLNDNTHGVAEVDFTAFDLVRVLMLARAGVTAGLLEPAEAIDTGLVAAAGLRESYGSWAEACDHYWRGRWYWAGVEGLSDQLHRQHELHAVSLLASDPHSPWTRLDWNMPLPAPQYLALSAVGELEQRSGGEFFAGGSTPPRWLTELESRIGFES